MKRWLDGGRPRRDAVDALCDALSVRLRRPVTPEDIGLAPSRPFDPNVGLVYPDSPEDAIKVLGDLWDADLDDDSPLTSVATNASAWSNASLAWLVRPGRDELGLRASGLAVGANDILALRATTESFASLDDQFGGRHARHALVQFLRTDLAPLLAGAYSDSIGRAICSRPRRRPLCSPRGCLTTQAVTVSRSATSCWPCVSPKRPTMCSWRRRSSTP